MNGWCVGVVVVAVAVVVISLIAGEVERRNAERRTREAERYRQPAYVAALHDLALTCRRCRSLAPPIPGTGNRYKCGKCANQFAGARHGL